MTAKKEAVMNGVRSEIALASAQELINVWSLLLSPALALIIVFVQKTNEKCFAKCVTKPGTSLSGSEEVGPSTEFAGRR